LNFEEQPSRPKTQIEKIVTEVKEAADENLILISEDDKLNQDLIVEKQETVM